MSTVSKTVAIPADDPRRSLVVENPDNSNALHLGVVGDTYTILLSGTDTAGRFTLIDIHVSPGGRLPRIAMISSERAFAAIGRKGTGSLTF